MIISSPKDFLPVVLFYIFVLLAWLLPMVFALLRLRRSTLDATAKGVWVLAIMLLPIVGAMLFFWMVDTKRG